MRFRSAQERKKDSIEDGLHLSHDEDDDDDDDDTDDEISLLILHSMLAQVWSQANKLRSESLQNQNKTELRQNRLLTTKNKTTDCLQQQTKLSIAYNKKQNYRLLTLTRNKTTEYLQLQRQPKLVLVTCRPQQD
jgi:hypothetical protein